jgi:hypothetical protein
MFYLRVVSSINDPWCSLIKDDPVRPEIPIEQRIGDHAEVIFYVNEQDEPTAAICIRYCADVPTTVEQMINDRGSNMVAVFYTIWSYQSGAGGKLILDARKHIEKTRPTVNRFVTLSPHTAIARRFHLKNGAVVLRENDSTVNYEYA